MKDKRTISSTVLIVIICLTTIKFGNSWGWGGGEEPKRKEVKKDLYKILELTKKASKEEIKKQYRKLTRQFHPDRNPEHREKFTDVNEAYEILSDPKRRRVYDTKGYTAAKEFNPNNQESNDNDILSRFFGGQRRENKMEDFRIKLKVSLKDLYIGKEFDYKYTRNVICPHCRGSGADSDEDIHKCTKCGGQGVVIEKRQIAPGYIQQFQKHCPSCGGKGNVIKKQCHVCQSKKIRPSIEELSVFVEKGMKNGQEIVRN